MSASVRWPYFFTSSAVMIVTEAGASVIFCLYLEAPSTIGISIFNSPSRLISVGSTGLAGVGCASTARVIVLRERKANPQKTPLIILVAVRSVFRDYSGGGLRQA